MGDAASAFSWALSQAAATDSRLCIVCNDSAHVDGALAFRQRFPERVVDVGIAEQDMVGVAAGLANAGLRPFVLSAACFLTARALDQIKNVAYTGAPVALCGFLGGLGYGPLGAGHQAVEDVAWMRAVPGLAVIAPATPRDAVAMLHEVLARPRPVYVRFGARTCGPTELFDEVHTFRYGRAAELRSGGDITLFASGTMTCPAAQASSMLVARGVRAGLVHLGSIDPIDEDAVVRAVGRSGRAVVVEDHVEHGGLGGAVAEVLVRARPVPVLEIGIPGEYAPVGPTDHLHEYFGLTASGIVDRVQAWLVKGLRAGRGPDERGRHDA